MKKLNLIKMKLIIIILFIGNLLFIMPASALIVFDPSNFGQNVKTALSTYQMVQRMNEQLFYLKNKQYGALMGQLTQLQTTYNLHLTNLMDLENIAALLAENHEAINGYQGSSRYSELESLNPDSGDYVVRRNEILRSYYHAPEDPSVVSSDFSGILSKHEIDTMTQDAKLNQNNYARWLDTLTVAAKQKQAQIKRQQYIQQYHNRIEQLGAKSELKTQQLTASELNLLLQQQEAEADSLRRLQQSQTDTLAEKTSANAEDFEHAQDRLLKATQQGSSGIGRNTWGNF